MAASNSFISSVFVCCSFVFVKTMKIHLKNCSQNWKEWKTIWQQPSTKRNGKTKCSLTWCESFWADGKFDKHNNSSCAFVNLLMKNKMMEHLIIGIKSKEQELFTTAPSTIVRGESTIVMSVSWKHFVGCRHSGNLIGRKHFCFPYSFLSCISFDLFVKSCVT